MTVAELEGRISAHELVEWRAWYALGADEQFRADMQRGVMARLEARTRRKPKGG